MSYLIGELYEKYKKDIYYYLYGLTHNQNLSEDLTSEVFVSAIISLASFKGNSDIKTWLFSIARHKWYEHIRKDKKEQLAVDRLEICYIDEGDITAESYMNKEKVERIKALLSKENEKTQKIVQLRVQCYSFYEIAQMTGLSESSARVIDFRTKKKIREILVKEGYYE